MGLQPFEEVDRLRARRLRGVEQERRRALRRPPDVLHEAPLEEDTEGRDAARRVDRDRVALAIVQDQVAVFEDGKPPAFRLPHRRSCHDRLD